MQLTFDAQPKETQVAAESSNALSMVSPIAWIVFIALATQVLAHPLWSRFPEGPPLHRESE
jgi:hypothetical protein